MSMEFVINEIRVKNINGVVTVNTTDLLGTCNINNPNTTRAILIDAVNETVNSSLRTAAPQPQNVTPVAQRIALLKLNTLIKTGSIIKNRRLV